MRPLRLSPWIACAALAAAAGPAAAQYKVVGPDGSVTYTDRPPTAAPVQVTPLARREPAAPAASPLPFELQQLAARFPVTLYTQTECQPCDAARTQLRQRGVPYAEKRIVSDEDILALERLVGGRTVPALTIGQQALRGLNPGEWDSYLDAAGYPRESRLPRTWQPPEPVPLVAARTPQAGPRAAAPVPVPVPLPAAERRPPEPPPAESGFRF